MFIEKIFKKLSNDFIKMVPEYQNEIQKILNFEISNIDINIEKSVKEIY